MCPTAETNRYVMDGALVCEHPQAATVMLPSLNRRRVMGAPYAFAQAGLWLQLLQRCLCNYDWLEARCKANSPMVYGRGGLKRQSRLGDEGELV